jgi:hypothetical protein
MQTGIKIAHKYLPGDTTNEAREYLAGMDSDLTWINNCPWPWPSMWF